MGDDVWHYRDRMKDGYFFKLFKVYPEWTPGTGDVEGFIHDEVVRQGWNPKTPDGRLRLEWMEAAWRWAQGQHGLHPRPTINDMLTVASLVEVYENRDGYRTTAVFVGNREGAKHWTIADLVGRLWEHVDEVKPVQGRGTSVWGHREGIDGDLTADDFYLEFENIHPFGDGNGRTGKILHNWLLDTLDDPVLVHNYFGGGSP